MAGQLQQLLRREAAADAAAGQTSAAAPAQAVAEVHVVRPPMLPQGGHLARLPMLLRGGCTSAHHCRAHREAWCWTCQCRLNRSRAHDAMKGCLICCMSFAAQSRPPPNRPLQGSCFALRPPQLHTCPPTTPTPLARCCLLVWCR